MSITHETTTELALRLNQVQEHHDQLLEAVRDALVALEKRITALEELGNHPHYTETPYNSPVGYPGTPARGSTLGPYPNSEPVEIRGPGLVQGLPLGTFLVGNRKTRVIREVTVAPGGYIELAKDEYLSTERPA